MTGNKRPTIIPGLVLIVVAVIMLFSHFGAFRLDWGNLWAYVILVIGILFWIAFVFDRAKSGLIMPGTVLITVGIVFVLNEAGYADIGSTWPFFILAPAFGFYMMYLVGNRERGNLVPATILTIIGVIFLI